MMAFFKKYSLKTKDDERTKAAELTLKQSIYPLCLVTILFFLWVSCSGEAQLIESNSNTRDSPMVFSIL